MLRNNADRCSPDAHISSLGYLCFIVYPEYAQYSVYVNSDVALLSNRFLIHFLESKRN